MGLVASFELSAAIKRMWNLGCLFDSSLLVGEVGTGSARLAEPTVGIWKWTLRTESGAIGAMGVGRASPSFRPHSILASLIQSRVALMTGTAAQTQPGFVSPATSVGSV